MADTYYWYTYLQQPRDEHVVRYILEQYEMMYERYAGCSSVPNSCGAHATGGGEGLPGGSGSGSAAPGPGRSTRERLLASGQLVELSFSELEWDPLCTLRKVYDAFGWVRVQRWPAGTGREQYGGALRTDAMSS